MIIFISGSVNSGKTTVAGVLERRIPRTAILEVDAVRHMIEWMPLDESIPINLENAISLTKNFTKHGLNTIITYPIRKENHDYLMDSLKDLNEKIYVFTLALKLEKILRNRGTRELTDGEIERIKYHYGIGINNPSFGEIIDNTDQLPEETAELILEKIK